MHRILYLLLLAGYLMVACRTGKTNDQATTSRRLIFGEGGGFTGAVTTYTLQPDGQLQRTDSRTSEAQKAGSISPKQAAALFARAERLLEANRDFNHPGNQYYFVKLEDGNTQRGAIWGATTQPAPAGLEALYEELLKTIKP